MRQELLGESNTKPEDVEHNLSLLQAKIQRLQGISNKLKFTQDYSDNKRRQLQQAFISENEAAISLCRNIMSGLQLLESARQSFSSEDLIRFEKITISFSKEYQLLQKVSKEGRSSTLIWSNSSHSSINRQETHQTLVPQEDVEQDQQAHQVEQPERLVRQLAISDSTDAFLQQGYAIASETRDDLMQLGKDMDDLQGSYQELYKMIMTQGEDLDLVYANVSDVKQNTSETVIELKSANRTAASGSIVSRMILFLIILTILIVAAIIVILVMKPFS